jgi:hypothetical protein
MTDEQTTQKAEEKPIEKIEEVKIPVMGDDIDFTTPYVEEDDKSADDKDKPAEADKPEANEDENKDDDSFDIKSVDIKGKWNDQEIPAYEMLEKALKFAKDNPDDATVKDIIGNIQKAYDYTHVAESKKELKATKEFVNAVQLENYALKYGEPPIEAVLDPLADINGEVEEIDGQKTMVFNSREDYQKYKNAEKELIQNYQTVIKNKNATQLENKAMFEDFSKKYPEVPISKLVEEVNTYLNPTVTMGQVPFPKDALEVFYKGKNFDKLAEDKVKEAVAKVYKELDIKQGKSEKTISNATKAKVVEKDDYDGGFDDALDNAGSYI